MSNLFSLSYWTNMRPGELGMYAQFFFVGFVVVLLLVYFLCWTIKKQKRKSLYNRIWRKISSFSLANFIISLFLLFFVYENLPFLSMRLWFLLWVAGMLVWLYFIIKEILKIPNIKEEMAKEEEFNKYIP
ncbi:MAG: hypothetical protein U9R06_03545 [Patescibacteria group bacterium]|nr:hypothetical protein [Patescibacteria group bacterium]